MLSYIDQGRGPVLVFVHSYLWDKHMWDPQIEFLKTDYRCISLDLIGHGESRLLEEKENISFEKLAFEITETLHYLGVEKYTYLGLSLGGMLAPYIHRLNRGKIEKLILMDTFLGVEPESSKQLYLEALNSIKSVSMIPEHVINKVAPIFFSPRTIIEKKTIYTDFIETLKNIEDTRLPTIIKIGLMLFERESTLNYLYNCEIPIYYLTGEDDLPRPFSEAILMDSLTPNSKLYKIKNAGHISTLENPEEVNSLLSKILNEDK